MLAKYVAPGIVSPIGKSIIVFLFLTLSIFAAYACAYVKVDFSFDTYLADTERLIFKHRELKTLHYSDIGSDVGFYTLNDTVSYLSEQSQLKMLMFDDALHRC